MLCQAAQAEDFTAAQLKKEIAWQALNVIDYGQTRYISQHCDQYREINPFLNKCPSANSVATYFAASAILHYLISKKLTVHRDTWQNISIIVTGFYAYNNYRIGIRINY